MTTLSPQPTFGVRRPARDRLFGCLLIVSALATGGCASISNPVGDAIPARRIPADYLARSKEELKAIPVTALQQPQADAYRLAPGDTLGVYIEGILGDKNQPLPVIVRSLDQNDLPPAIGYPIPVRDDGTLPLPFVDPLKVTGMTVREAENAVRQEYTEKKSILVKGRERILVTLYRARQYKINVVRQETPQVTLTAGVQSQARRGGSIRVDLPAGENDILNALVKSGGLPGLDSLNEVRVERYVKGEGIRVIRIPLRIPEGEPIPFDPKDVILETGDTVFIEARDTEYYYVGGLAQSKQLTLPRDYDVHVTEAIMIAAAPFVNGAVNQSNLTGSILANGIGTPSPSQVTVVRRTKNNGQIKINVNLNRALNNPRENIIVMSGDTLILQETPGEAITRYMTNTFRFSYVFRLIGGTRQEFNPIGNLP